MRKLLKRQADKVMAVLLLATVSFLVSSIL